MNAPVLNVHGLQVSYRQRPVLCDVDLTIRGPGLIAIVGPNGAGKSTFLKAILGLIPRDAGEVQVLGEPISSVRKRVGYVPQRESVDWDFPASAFDVALMGTYGKLGWFRRAGAAEWQLARECLHRVGLWDLDDRQIGQLSGGQQQRVFLARALAQRADVYFMDEPTSGVDAATEEVVFDLLGDLRDEGKTVFVVHHDLNSVPRHFDEVILLDRQLIAAGPTSSTFTTENLHRTYGGRLVQFTEAVTVQ